MASLVGQQLKDTYDSLLKTSDNDALGGTYKEITDGSGNGSNLYLGTGGNVGIGGSPNYKLDVLGSVRLKTGDTATPVIVSTGGDSQGTLRFGSTSTEYLIRGGADYLAMIFNANSSEAMRIRSGGDISFRDTSTNEAFYWDASTARLGLGTTSPAYPLDVNGTMQIGAGVTGLLRFNASAFGQIVSATRMIIDSDTHDFRSGSGSDFMRIDSSGNVKIGASTTATPSTNADDLVIDKGASESGITIMSTAAATLRFGDAGNSSIGVLEYNHNSDYMRMIVNDNERLRIDSSGNVSITTGNLILDSGAGIDFSDTANSSGTMTSELLDDYEEGTWTPEYAPTTGSFATMTYPATKTGKYTKIGNVVYFSCFINTNNVDVTGASGVIKLTGLPFTSNSTTGSGSRVGLARRFAGEHPSAWQINASSSEMTFWYYTALNSDPSLFDTSDLTTGASADQNQLYVTGFYFT